MAEELRGPIIITEDEEALLTGIMKVHMDEISMDNFIATLGWGLERRKEIGDSLLEKIEKAVRALEQE